MEIKAQLNDLRTKYGKTAIKVGIGVVILIGLVIAGHYYAGRAAQEFADGLRSQFRQENQALYDNLAVLKDRTQQLEYNYGVQKGELVVIRNKQKGNTSNVFKNPDKKVIAQFFDNTVDNYIPVK